MFSQEGKKTNDFAIVSLSKGEWRFRSPKAHTICRLVSHFLDGLRERSRYGLALRDTVEGGERICILKIGNFLVRVLVYY